MIFGGGLIMPPPATTALQTSSPTRAHPSTVRRYHPEKNLKRFDSPEYGIQAFLWWKHDVARRDLDLIHDMGFKWVKHIFSWRDLEQIQKGHYDWYTADTIINLANRRGLKILARLDRQPFWAQDDGGAVKLDSAPPKIIQTSAIFVMCLRIVIEERSARLSGVERAEPCPRVGQPPAQRRRVRTLTVILLRRNQSR